MKKQLLIGLAIMSGFVLSPRAQGADQQIINDAAAAIGGRERVLAVRTLIIEGAGHDMTVAQALRQADASVGDLTAPANVVSATSAAPGTPTREIAKGVWFIEGTTHHSLLVEFNDHLMLVEAPNDERTAAVLAKARELRPNKPVTTLLVTHHHSDHTGGVRLAVAEGVSEIITHQSNVAYINEVLKRPHTINPDALAKKAGAKLPKITSLGDEGVAKDSTMTVNLYHILDNTHADSMLMLYFPNGKILTQADIYMPNDARNVIDGEPLGHAPWLQNVMANINHRRLQVEWHAPIHGEYVPHSQFLESLIFMTQYLPKKNSTN